MTRKLNPWLIRFAILPLAAGCGDHDKLVGTPVGAVGTGGRTLNLTTEVGGNTGGTTVMSGSGGSFTTSAGMDGQGGGNDASRGTVGLGGSEGGAAGAGGTSGGAAGAANDIGGAGGVAGGHGGTSSSAGSASLGGAVQFGGQSTGAAAGRAGSDGTGGATKLPCALVDCRPHSHCVAKEGDIGTCLCDAGYAKEGLQCYSTSPIVDVASGDAHSCALRADGTVGCWGWNMDGALGDGGVVADSPIPLMVPNVSNAIAIGADGHATCALLADRTVKCWGFLGGGRTAPSPVLIDGLSNVTSITVGGPSSCAVLEDGSAHCWGALSPTDNIASLTPIRVSRDSGPKVRSMFAGYGRIWAILADDTVHALAASGDVISDELLLEHASCFSTGVNSKAPPCVVLQDGSVGCPEANATGIGAPWIFTPLNGYKDIVALGRGIGYRCGLRGDGGVICSGSNTYGELCDGTFTSRDTALPAVGLSNTTKIAAAWFHGCAVDTAGKLRCWGMDSHGALGDGHDEFPLEIPSVGRAMDLCLGSESACVVDDAAVMRCWGNGYPTSTPSAWLSGVSSCSGGATACAVMQDGTVQCWGSNDQGQLGDGTKVTRSVPTAVPGLSQIVQASTGTHSCAVRIDGSVLCWGRNDFGQVGDGTTLERLSPVVVGGVTAATRVAVGTSHSCAALRDGSVRCWGDNALGQLGNGTTATQTGAVTALGLAGVESLFILGNTTRALNGQGDGFTWGGWVKGTSDDETEVVVDHTPHPWSAPRHVAEVASPYCLRLRSGEVQCNYTGSWARLIGWGETKRFVVNSSLSCAITSTNQVLCSGVGWNGELGDSYRSHRSRAELVASW